MAAIRNTNFYELAMVGPSRGQAVAPVLRLRLFRQARRRRQGRLLRGSGRPGLGVRYDWDFIEARTRSATWSSSKRQTIKGRPTRETNRQPVVGRQSFTSRATDPVERTVWMRQIACLRRGCHHAVLARGAGRHAEAAASRPVISARSIRPRPRPVTTRRWCSRSSTRS